MAETAEKPVTMGSQDSIKLAVRGLYDTQKLRIQLELRIERLVRDGIMTKDEAKEYFALPFRHFEQAELAMEGMVWKEIKHVPIVKDWLAKVKGIGPRISGLIVANIVDIGRFDTVSKLWAYTGLHVIDGKSVKRAKAKPGEEAVKANWNHELKTTMWKAAGCLIKVKGPYRELYDRYKAQITERTINEGKIIWACKEDSPSKYSIAHVPDDIVVEDIQVPTTPPEWSLGRINNMALRYIAKRLLAHIWLVWREMDNLPTREPYCTEYLGHSPDSLDNPWKFIEA